MDGAISNAKSPSHCGRSARSDSRICDWPRTAISRRGTDLIFAQARALNLSLRRRIGARWLSVVIAPMLPDYVVNRIVRMMCMSHGFARAAHRCGPRCIDLGGYVALTHVALGVVVFTSSALSSPDPRSCRRCQCAGCNVYQRSSFSFADNPRSLRVSRKSILYRYGSL